MNSPPGYDELVSGAVAAQLKGWDFSWLSGRAVGSDPSWSYPSTAEDLVRRSTGLLDIDTGGGELLASFAPLPARAVATEGWAPNLPVARERLAPLGVDVRFAEDRRLPVETGSVDLVLDRHGRLDAEEIARVLQPGGVLLTQQVGSDDCAEINAALGAPAAYEATWNADTAVKALTAAGFTVTDVREEWPAFSFYDVGALVFQLRAVPWQIKDFTPDGYDDELRRIDERIRAHGAFTVRAHRFLVVAHTS